jgi:hypothetical protein
MGDFIQFLEEAKKNKPAIPIPEQPQSKLPQSTIQQQPQSRPRSSGGSSVSFTELINQSQQSRPPIPIPEQPQPQPQSTQTMTGSEYLLVNSYNTARGVYNRVNAYNDRQEKIKTQQGEEFIKTGKAEINTNVPMEFRSRGSQSYKGFKPYSDEELSGVFTGISSSNANPKAKMNVLNERVQKEYNIKLEMAKGRIETEQQILQGQVDSKNINPSEAQKILDYKTYNENQKLDKFAYDKEKYLKKQENKIRVGEFVEGLPKDVGIGLALGGSTTIISGGKKAGKVLKTIGLAGAGLTGYSVTTSLVKGDVLGAGLTTGEFIAVGVGAYGGSKLGAKINKIGYEQDVNKAFKKVNINSRTIGKGKEVNIFQLDEQSLNKLGSVGKKFNYVEYGFDTTKLTPKEKELIPKGKTRAITITDKENEVINQFGIGEQNLIIDGKSQSNLLIAKASGYNTESGSKRLIESMSFKNTKKPFLKPLSKITAIENTELVNNERINNIFKTQTKTTGTIIDNQNPIKNKKVADVIIFEEFNKEINKPTNFRDLKTNTEIRMTNLESLNRKPTYETLNLNLKSYGKKDLSMFSAINPKDRSISIPDLLSASAEVKEAGISRTSNIIYNDKVKINKKDKSVFNDIIEKYAEKYNNYLNKDKPKQQTIQESKPLTKQITEQKTAQESKGILDNIFKESARTSQINSYDTSIKSILSYGSKQKLISKSSNTFSNLGMDYKFKESQINIPFVTTGQIIDTKQDFSGRATSGNIYGFDFKTSKISDPNIFPPAFAFPMSFGFNRGQA